MRANWVIVATLVCLLTSFYPSHLSAQSVSQNNEATTLLLEEKLKSLILPKVEFSGTPFEECLKILTQLAIDQDASLEDSGFKLINHSPEANETEIYLRLTNVPFSEAIRYATALAKTNFVVIGPVVAISSYSTPPLKDLPTAAFNVSAESAEAFRSQSAQNVLIQSGIQFPPGSTVIFLEEPSKLIVRNRADQIERIVPSLKHSRGIELELVEDDRFNFTQAKLDTIVIPEIDFVDLPLVQSLEMIQALSVEHDPETDRANKGINLVLSGYGAVYVPGAAICPPLFEPNPEITLRLYQVTLGDALRYTSNLAELELTVHSDRVVLAPRKPKEP